MIKIFDPGHRLFYTRVTTPCLLHVIIYSKVWYLAITGQLQQRYSINKSVVVPRVVQISLVKSEYHNRYNSNLYSIWYFTEIH